MPDGDGPGGDLSREQKELVAAAYIEKVIRRSRDDPNVFIEYALLDDKGRPLVQQWFHSEWQDLLTEHDRLVVFSSVDHGKSVNVSITRPLWELGRHPTSRGCIISDTATQSAKFLTAVKANIEANPRLHDVFPHLRRENFRTWRDDAILFEPSEPTTEKDFTIQAVGIGGAIMGARFNWMILDDVLNMENTWTEEQCQKTIEWFQTTVVPRALKGCKIWVIGTAWSPYDLMHWLEETGEYHVVRYPAAIPPESLEEKTGKTWSGATFHNKVPIWKERWPVGRLMERERQLSPFRFNQLHMCQAVDEALVVFPPDAFKKMKLKGLNLPYSPKDWDGPAFTGMDLSAGKTRRHAQTVLFTIGGTPDGERYILDIRAGRWHASQIEMIMAAVHERFDSIFMVENNAVQQLVVEFFQTDLKIPIQPFATGRNKAHPEFGVASMAIEMMQGLWIAPNTNGILHPEVQSWVNECAAYTPQAHTGDRLMASWFAREALRRYERHDKDIQVRCFGEKDSDKRRKEKP